MKTGTVVILTMTMNSSQLKMLSSSSETHPFRQWPLRPSKIQSGNVSLSEYYVFGAVHLIMSQRYPAAARNHIHHTKAYIPTDIAVALTKNPSLVQKAVESFYTRDAIQLRVRFLTVSPLNLEFIAVLLQAAHRMNRFPPNSSMLSTVKMSRTAYAQLVGQKFFPPKVFGQWQEAEGTKEWRWRDVGMKIVSWLST